MVAMIAFYRAQLVECRVHRDDRERKVAFGITSKMFHRAILHYLK